MKASFVLYAVLFLTIQPLIECMEKVSQKDTCPAIVIREAKKSDFAELKKLYQNVAKHRGGIAREYDEITDEYIKKILDNALSNGKIYVAEANGTLIGSVHAYKPEPRAFHHIFSDLTIAVHSDFQGKGVGKQLFSSFLNDIKNSDPSIARVELFVRESNKNAINFYKSLGFILEGKLEKRIRAANNKLEADIQMAWFNPHYKDAVASKL